jgi:hypothetical protein
LLGALLVLSAFAALQAGLVSARSRVYLGLNLAGSAILGTVALDGRQFGFLLLNITWAAVAIWALFHPDWRDKAPGAR